MNIYLAFFRHTAGYCWAYNTRNFFQFYYPKFDIGLWTFCASVFGGSFGVFAGGFFSDRFLPLTIPHPYLIIIPLSDLWATSGSTRGSGCCLSALCWPRPWLWARCTSLPRGLLVRFIHRTILFEPLVTIVVFYLMPLKYCDYSIIRMPDCLLLSCWDLVCCPVHCNRGNCSSRNQVTFYWRILAADFWKESWFDL